MRHLIMALFLSSAIAGLSYAQSQAQQTGTSDTNTSETGDMQSQRSQDGQSQSQDGASVQAGVDPADMVVRGTVVTTDPDTNQIVITDYVTGYDRTFTVTDSSVLENIEVGDTVEVNADSSQKNASDVKKQ